MTTAVLNTLIVSSVVWSKAATTRNLYSGSMGANRMSAWLSSEVTREYSMVLIEKGKMPRDGVVVQITLTTHATGCYFYA